MQQKFKVDSKKAKEKELMDSAPDILEYWTYKEYKDYAETEQILAFIKVGGRVSKEKD